MSCSSAFVIVSGEYRAIRVDFVGADGLPFDISGLHIVCRLTNGVGVTVLEKRSAAAGGSALEVEILDQVTQTGGALAWFTDTDTTTIQPGVYTFSAWDTVGGKPEVAGVSKLIIAPGPSA